MKLNVNEQTQPVFRLRLLNCALTGSTMYFFSTECCYPEGKFGAGREDFRAACDACGSKRRAGTRGRLIVKPAELFPKGLHSAEALHKRSLSHAPSRKSQSIFDTTKPPQGFPCGGIFVLCVFLNYTNSRNTASATSPWRGPSFKILVYPPLRSAYLGAISVKSLETTSSSLMYARACLLA